MAMTATMTEIMMLTMVVLTMMVMMTTTVMLTVMKMMAAPPLPDHRGSCFFAAKQRSAALRRN